MYILYMQCYIMSYWKDATIMKIDGKSFTLITLRITVSFVRQEQWKESRF